MAEKRDVTARLADGMPAVLTVQQYVAASAQVGYRHPDLTVHAGQLQDWYRSEDGMDLEALLHDCDALEAAASAADEAIQVQDRQRAALPEVWQGAGAAASAEFLRRHSDASATVAAALHTAREAMAMLREQLWEAVDNKVEAVIEIEGRAATTRTEWSAAAATVTSGVGDRATANELVDQAVKPFVDSTIRTDWLAAMRSAMSSVTTAYQQATEDMAGVRLADFAIPGDLGPVWSAPTPPSGDRPDEEPWSVASVPAPAPVVGSAGGVTAPAVPAPPTAPAAWPAPAPADMSPAPAEAAPPAMPSLGSAGPALPGLGGGGGLSGLGQPFADALTGLLGGGGGLPEPAPLDVPELDDPVDTVELEDEDEDEDADEDEDLVDDADEDDADEDPAEDPDEPPGGEPEEPGEGAAGEPMPAPTPPPPPPPAESLPPVAETEVGERTPCEIAADELPQVGESLPTEPGGG